MAFFGKSLLTVASLSGGCCTVTIPITMSTGGSSPERTIVGAQINTSLEQNSKEGKKGSNWFMQKCNDSNAFNLEEVSYGSDEIKEICWKLKNNDSLKNLGNQEIQKYTNLFQEEGRSSRSNREISKGVVTCRNSGIIVNEDNRKNILGFCGDSNLDSNVPFVEKTMEQNGQITLKICIQDCFEKNTTTGKVGNMQNGAEVVFYKYSNEKIN